MTKIRHKWFGLVGGTLFLLVIGVISNLPWNPLPRENKQASTTRPNTNLRSANSSFNGAIPPEIAQAIAVEEKVDNACNNGAGNDSATMAACQRRDKMVDDLNSKGWCWNESGGVGAKIVWVMCNAAPSASSRPSQ